MPKFDDRAGRAGVAPSDAREEPPQRMTATDDPEDGAALQEGLGAGSGPQGRRHGDNGEPLLVRAGEAARLLGISERHFWQLVQRGEIPVRHLGRRTLVARSAIQKIAAGREP